jgi:filamentous hemagglutinin family protein
MGAGQRIGAAKGGGGVKKSRVRLGQLTVIAASIQLIFADAPALANPTGPQVVSGAASIQRPDARSLSITNTPGTIINWQGFSIGAGELTRFIQQSPSSAVLNRVVGADISQIYGQLLSNGRVFLINPSGIVIGPGAVVDTAGFVASTLNMLDSDFLAGKLKFQGDASSGSIINQGWIRTGYGGQVILVAPQIENSGLIHTPGGEILLAAGKKLTVTSLDLEGVQFEVQAPTDSVLNIGKLLADGGAVGVFAGSLRHSGEIRANALVYDQAGRIVLKAQNDIQLTTGSITSADGRVGGDITVQSAGGLTRIAGTVSAQGSAGQGGDIKLLGDRVAVVENAVVDASGATGGGEILVGGAFQGSNSAIQNSNNTIVGTDAALRADATQSGDGGRIIVWSDDKTQFYGNLSAQGGSSGGNGGFAEVSGKQNLIFAGSANLAAPKGSMGDLLLDPLDLYVFNGGGGIPSITDESTDFPTNAATVSPATLAAISGNVTLFASRYMRISDPINLTTAAQGLSAQVGTYTPPALPDPLALSTSVPNRLDIGADITTNGGAVSLSAPTIQSVATSTINTAGGAISLNAANSISASALSLDAGAGAVSTVAGTGGIQLDTVMGGSFSATAPSFIGLGDVTTSGAITIASSGSSINTGQMTTSGGNVSVSAPFSISTDAISTNGGSVALTSASSSIFTDDIVASSGPVTLSGASVFTNTIDTTGAVALTATQGSISATVDNASSLTASATNSSGSAFVNIGSNTDLNANSVSATTTACFSFFGCQSGSVNLFATGNVNVGTVNASAPVSGNNSISESINVSSSGGSIRAMSASSQITAADVNLATAQGSGGGIGTAGAALKVDVERNFTFQPNGEFNVVLNGTGPSGFNTQIGVAAAGQSYSGTLIRSGGGLTLSASADDTAVTISNLSITSGFDQLVFNSSPSINVNVPNGALVATSVTVPAGSLAIAPGVNLSANGDVTLTSYTRLPGGPASLTGITASGVAHNVTLGLVDSNQDNVSVSAASTITVGSIQTGGNVTVTGGSIVAQTDAPGLEIAAGGAISIEAAQNIGASGAGNPLDLAAPQITLTTLQSGFGIGGATGAVVADTPDLTINAAGPFNVSTGSTALQKLAITADPFGVGSGGLAKVQSDADYIFVSDGTNFSFNPAAAFNNSQLSFTGTSGDVTLGNLDMGPAGTFTLNVPNGSISAGTLDGAAINFTAGTVSGAAVSILTGDIGGTNRPDTLQINSGNNGFFTQRAGSVETGAINAGDVTIQSYNGNIDIGSPLALDIGSGATPAGNVSLNADSLGGSSGTIRVANIFADSITLRSPNNSIDTGTLNASASINAITDVSVTTGALDSPSITIVRNSICCVNPDISIGSIGNGDSGIARPATNILIAGSTTTINGPVVGANSVDNFSISANGGRIGSQLLTVNGDITAGNGSFIGIGSASSAAPFQFTKIDAGSTGTVLIESNQSIRQQFGGLGITAKNVTLNAAEDILGSDSSGGAANMDLIGVKNLTFSTGGDVLLDVHNTPLDSLSITTSASTPDVGGIAFTNMGGSQAFAVTDLGDFGLAVSAGTNPLDFTFNASATGIQTTGSGIATGGGNVALSASGGFDGTTGGITTSGGSANISVSGAVTTGAIDTSAPGNAAGGFIAVNAPAIDVNGNFNTGTGGASISLSASNGAITRSGGATITSDTSVSASALNGDVGVSGTPLLISTPDATLSARSNTAGAGNVFATLTGTSTLNLTADNDFDVSSTAALSTLILNTEGTGTGTTLNLASLGQTFSFARPTTDLFTIPITNTFQVVSVAGATPVANATFGVLDGDLLIAGSGTVNPTNLTLQNFSGGDVKLQGDSTNPLSLSNTTQTFSTSRDLLITGNVTLNASASQSILATRDVIAQAQDGSIAISAATQNISSSIGKIAFRGGTAADEKVTVSATGSQDISTSQFNLGNVELTAGTGDRTSVTVSYSGTGTQTIQAGGTIQIDGGTGTSVDSTASITTATGSQLIRAEGDINLNTIGGSGTNATARIANTGTGNQQIGESRTTCCSFFPYQTANITLQGGSGSGSFAEITAAGAQQIYSQFGTLSVLGGSGTNAYAKIASSSTSEQQIGLPFFNSGFRLGSINMQGGTGAGAFAQISSTGVQRVTTTGAVTVKAGTGNAANAALQSSSSQDISIGNLTVEGTGGAGATATAQILAVGSQNIDANAISLIGGAGSNSFARINTPADQSLSFGSLALTAGSASGTYAQVDAGGSQTMFGGSITLTAMGTDFGPIANASAIIEGNSQFFSGGSIVMNGGVGPDAGNSSNAWMRNLSGSQSVSSFGSITLNGGSQFSTTGILNQGTGTQSVSGSGGISLNSDPISSNASVLIQNSPATAQTITASFGGLSLNNSGDGSVGVTSAGTQTITARYVEVLTGAGSTGNATLSATGDQYIRTTNENSSGESLVVAALGSGTAKIESAASQLLEVGYPLIMQGANGAGLLSIGRANGVDAAGNSLVQAVDQNVFAGSIVVQGPSGAGNTSKLSATNVQTISTLLGGIEVSGGAGDNSLATVDPITQTILTNGSADVSGGSGGNADGSIVSAGTQTLVNTNGDVTLTGGSGAGADAIISSLGAQNIISSGNVALTGGTGINTDALISSSTTQFIQAGGDISLIGGPISGSDAIISNIGAQQGCSLLSFQCGAQQTLLAGGSIILSPGIGNALIEGGFSSNSTGVGAFLSADTTQQTLANMDEFGSAFDALAPGEEDPDIGRKVPICR